MVDLTSDLLFVYALKLNNVTVDDDVIVRYMAHCDKNLVEKNQADPFTMADLKKKYAAKLKCTPKVGRVKHYPVIERVRYCTGLFPFNRDLILYIVVILYIFIQSLHEGFWRFKFFCI